MRELADHLYLIESFPNHTFNIYLMGNVLVDSATRYALPRIMRQLKSQRVTAHTLTHAHPDHQGASKAVCETLKIPLYCGEPDAHAMETGKFDKVLRRNFVTNLIDVGTRGPGHPVERTLHEGDELGDFTVLEVPGHSPGHLAYWRESDRALILGDVAFNMHPFTGLPHLSESPAIFTLDPAQNRESLRKLAALNPRLVCFGHGPPITNGQRFVDLVAGLS